MAEYDDKNRGALFTDGKPGWTGKVNFNGQDYYGALVTSGAQSERAPSHKLFLEVAQQGGAVCIPLWRDAPDKPSFASGKHEGHFVNAYQNKSDSGKVYLSIQFKAMQAREGGEAAPAPQHAPAATDSLI